MSAAPTREQVEAAVVRVRRARILACGAWSDVMEGGSVNVRKCNGATT